MLRSACLKLWGCNHVDGDAHGRAEGMESLVVVGKFLHGLFPHEHEGVDCGVAGAVGAFNTGKWLVC